MFTREQIEAAGRQLISEGAFHSWFSSRSYDDLDVVSRGEFDAITERILSAGGLASRAADGGEGR